MAKRTQGGVASGASTNGAGAVDAGAEAGTAASPDDPVKQWHWFDPTIDARFVFRNQADAFAAADKHEMLRIRGETESGKPVVFDRTPKGWVRNDGPQPLASPELDESINRLGKAPRDRETKARENPVANDPDASATGAPSRADVNVVATSTETLPAAGAKPKTGRSKNKASSQSGRTGRARGKDERHETELFNGVEAATPTGEVELDAGATAYVDPKFNTVAVAQGDKIYLLGGSAAVEKFAKRSQLSEKDRDTLRELQKSVADVPSDGYDQEVLKRVALLRRQRNQQVRNAHDQASHEPLEHEEIRERPRPVPTTATAAPPAKDAIPPEIQKHYLKVANKFFYADRPDVLAFVDKGERLETKSDTERTADNLVAIAESRGWDAVKVSGSQAFRREVWLEASARGMAVRGYKASDVDRALLEHRIANGRYNAVEREDAPAAQRGRSEPPQTAPANDSTAGATNPTTAEGNGKAGEPRSSKQHSGILLEHGPANFNFDRDESRSYFVRLLQDDQKERVVWGVKLPEALAKAGARQGDRITLERTGAEDVTVDKNVRDGRGQVVGREIGGAQRREWKVDISEESKQARRAEAAEDFRNLPLAEAAKRHPEQLGAAGVLAAANVVARDKLGDDRTREKFLQHARDKVAADVAAGREIREVQLHREKGKDRASEIAHEQPERGLERAR